jgi:hypothetical protein
MKVSLNLTAIGIAALYFILFQITSPVFLVRMWLSLFVWSMLFIWLPSFKKNVHFHDIALITIKAHALNFLLATVFLIGMVIVVGTTHYLLWENLPYQIYFHLVNFTYALACPLFILSYYPDYRETEIEGKDLVERMQEAAAISKPLHFLLNFIIVPLYSAFTFILALYILTNIAGPFWEDNTLETMLYNYVWIGVFTYLAVTNMDTHIVKWFKRIFPKFLVGITAFQLVNSLLMLNEEGWSHERYQALVIIICGLAIAIILSIYQSRRTHWVGACLVAMTILLVLTPTDSYNPYYFGHPTSNVDTDEVLNLANETTYSTERSSYYF